MLRAGPFSDERVVGLANRRFILFYFDLNDRGFAGDAKARAFVVAVKKELGGASVPTPPVLFMTADGRLVGEVSNYATEDQVLAAMQNALEKAPPQAKPSAEERDAQDPVDRARAAMDLLDYETANQLLEPVDRDEARYLQGHIARLQKDWKAMHAAFARIEEPSLADDLRMERAHEHWDQGDFDALLESVTGFSPKSPRYSESRYYFGLALYHLDQPAKALAIWKSTIEGCSQDPWIYRSDWAYSQAASGGQKTRSFSTAGGSPSLLGRIGYMGRQNPDLAPRR